MCSGSFLFCTEKVQVRRSWVLKECGVWNGLQELEEGESVASVGLIERSKQLFRMYSRKTVTLSCSELT